MTFKILIQKVDQDEMSLPKQFLTPCNGIIDDSAMPSGDVKSLNQLRSIYWREWMRRWAVPSPFQVVPGSTWPGREEI
ncbi:hypothetical protein FH972_014953 [Carpinus fangiana]|uniref:Uncharacterized protein n=1 Tax=Carpinus fangiana TaxID=176857 RepID=A0A5N6REW5_9ROSI|nr:hypothetical protein FH972_014953 [Carpinus fangiana]